MVCGGAGSSFDASAREDERLTYEIVSSCLSAKEAELRRLEAQPAAIREEFEGSLSYRIGKLLCPNSR